MSAAAGPGLAPAPGARAPALPERAPLGPSAAVAGVALVAYLLLAPTVSGDGDGSEFTLVLATCGMAHPTGYPIYTLLGHLFCRLLHALGAGWPYAANAWSAVGGAVAIFFLHATGARLARQAAPAAPAWTRDLAALLPVVIFGFDPIWTNEAMLAEVYAWHMAWVLGAVAFFLLQIDRLARDEGTPAQDARAAAGWGLLCGLGLAHHLTSVLIAAPLSLSLLVVLGATRRLRAALVGAALGAALVPLASYAFVAWRAFHPGIQQWEALEPSWRGVVGHITGARYQHFLGYFLPAEEQRRLLAHAGYPVLVPGLALLALALVRAPGPAPRLAWGSLLAAAGVVWLYASHYGVLDPAPYFLPALALGAIPLAPLAAELLGAVSARARPAALALALVIVAALGGVLAPWVSETRARRELLYMLERVVRSMWASVPPGPALVFWPDDRCIRLIEYQILRHEKPRLIIMDPEILADDYPRARFIARFGVDPLADLDVPNIAPGTPGEMAAIRRVLVQMVRNINARTRIPVVVFDLTKPEVRLLKKPWD